MRRPLIFSSGSKLVRGLLIVAALSGVLVGSLFVSYATTRSPSGSTEGLPIGGVAHIMVYNAQGQEVSSWTGHNTLFPSAAAAVAACLQGQPFPTSYTTIATQGTTGAFPGVLQGCSGFTPDILVAWVVASGVTEGGYCPASSYLAALGSCEVMSASNYLVPSGCTVNTCTGWDATATFPSTDFNASNGCATTCTIGTVITMQGTVWTGQIVAGYGAGTIAGGNGFDLLSPSITLAQGDSLQITIAYTVT